MSQGYIGYDLQNGIREELMNRGIYRTVSTVLTQVIVDPYDEAFYTPTKVLGRYMSAEEANEERKKGNYVIEEAGKSFDPRVVKVFLRSVLGLDSGLVNSIPAAKTAPLSFYCQFPPTAQSTPVGVV